MSENGINDFDMNQVLIRIKDLTEICIISWRGKKKIKK